MTNYQKMIFYRTYSRKSETWIECIDRYMKSIYDQLVKKNLYDININFTDLRDSLINMDIQPSMRLLANAGESIRRNNFTQYNCAYISMDSFENIGDLFYLLMSGCGVGISVENKYIDRFPLIPKIKETDKTFVIQDNKESWVYSLRSQLQFLSKGKIIKFNYSKIRKRGEILKISGGTSSGHEPLKDLHNFIINKFKEGENKKFRSIDIFDICCKIADIVVVGSVRRSAIISLIDKNDMNMIYAKHNNWHEKHPYRSNSCISVINYSKPTMSEFLNHFQHLYNNGSGENGIFNAHVATKQSDRGEIIGVNPCSEIIFIRSKSLCNLSAVVVRPKDTINTIKNKLKLATQIGMIQSLFNDFKHVSDEWRKNTIDDPIIGVCLGGIFDNKITATANKDVLKSFKDVVDHESKRMAKLLNQPEPRAFTSIKPMGTSSQLYDCASGIHANYAPYYIRRVNVSKDHPINDFLIDNGVEYEESIYNQSNNIFKFYFKSKGETDKEIPPLKHLNIIRKYTKYYTNHSVSNTVTVNDEKYLEVMNYIWKHYNDFVGITLFPEIGSIAQQPLEKITEEEYNSKPKLNIDWNKYKTDYINVVKECQGSQCET